MCARLSISPEIQGEAGRLLVFCFDGMLPFHAENPIQAFLEQLQRYLPFHLLTILNKRFLYANSKLLQVENK
jgi:hypothetical protein